MATLLETPTVAAPTLADLLKELGDIPPSRVRARPAPGTATVQDVVDIDVHEDRLFELVDGVLVEKAMGFQESLLAVALANLLRNYIKPRKLGVVVGPDGMMEILAGLVRMPDVAFVSANRFPDGRVPTKPVPQLVPDLAVEILSLGNTVAEMNRKRREYFRAGVRLVWLIDPVTRTLSAYTSPDEFRLFSQTESVSGAPVIPDFVLPLKALFSELDEM